MSIFLFISICKNVRLLLSDHLAKQEGIGFTAWAWQTRYYNSKDIVLFDRVESNHGDHYNGESSVFTCPRHALYAFHVSVHTLPGSHMSAWIAKEEALYTTAWVGNSYEFASTFAVMPCDRGQRVFVQCRSRNSEMLGGYYSTFSGFLIMLI